MLFFGTLSLLFGFFQVAIGDVSERRAQRSLTGAFRQLMASGAPLGAGLNGKPTIIPPGKPVSYLEIPALGIHKVVAEGTSGEVLKQAPGHLRTTPIPGQPGHSIIVGRRTTYGSPFRHIDLLQPGAQVYITNPYGQFLFLVKKVTRLAPGAATRLDPSHTSQLSLVTSDPAYRPSRALVVETELVGDPSTFVDPPRPRGRAGEVEFTGDVASLGGAMISGLLLLFAIAGAQLMYRNWRKWPTYLLTTPIILALLFAWMDGLLSTFPSTL